MGSCEPFSKASLKCIEDMGYDRDAAKTACKKHYDAYRDCRQRELDAKRAANQEAMKKQRAEFYWFLPSFPSLSGR